MYLGNSQKSETEQCALHNYVYATCYGPRNHYRSTFICSLYFEGTFARRAPGTPGAPSIQTNVPAIYHNALPPNITPSSSPGTLSTSTLYDCWQTNNFLFFRPTNGTITCTLPL